MPSKSPAQHNLMEAVAKNPSFAKKAGIPQRVGKEFAAADKGKKMAMQKAQAHALMNPKPKPDMDGDGY